MSTRPSKRTVLDSDRNCDGDYSFFDLWHVLDAQLTKLWLMVSFAGIAVLIWLIGRAIVDELA